MSTWIQRTALAAVAALGVLAADGLAQPMPDGNPLSEREEFRDRRYGHRKPSLGWVQMNADGLLVPRIKKQRFGTPTKPTAPGVADDDVDPDPQVVRRAPRSEHPLRKALMMQPTVAYDVDDTVESRPDRIGLEVDRAGAPAVTVDTDADVWR